MRYRTTFTVTVDYDFIPTRTALTETALFHLNRLFKGDENLPLGVSVLCKHEEEVPTWREIEAPDSKRGA